MTLRRANQNFRQFEIREVPMSYLLATILALAAFGGLIIDTWSNAVAIGGGTLQLNDTTAYVVAIAVLGALAGLFCPLAFRRHKVVGFFLAIGWSLGTLFSIGASLDRVGNAKDKAHQTLASANARLERMEKRIAGLRAKRDAEARLGGCGKRCMLWQSKLEAAQKERDSLGISREADPGGQRIEALTLGAVRAAHYRLFHPVVGVIALTALFNSLLLLAGAMLAADMRRTPIVVDAVANEIDPILRDLETNGSANNRELARRLGWSEARVSRRVKQLAEQGCVQAKQVGRSKMIAPV